MRGRVQRWGNSLVVRIPKALAVEAGLREDAVIEVRLADGNVILTRVPEAGYDLHSLLFGINPENIHDEVSTGGPVGNESW